VVTPASPGRPPREGEAGHRCCVSTGAYPDCQDHHAPTGADYDGTLTTERGCSLAIPPSNEVLALLNNLTGEPLNSVCIVSGRSREELSEYLKTTPVRVAAVAPAI
jgi:hypothetical protein